MGVNMSEYISSTVYFAQSGPVNTDRTLSLASEKAQLLGIQTVLVATTHGTTALRASELIQVPNLIAVTHSSGFKEPFASEFDAALRSKIEANGAKMLNGLEKNGVSKKPLLNQMLLEAAETKANHESFP